MSAVITSEKSWLWHQRCWCPQKRKPLFRYGYDKHFQVAGQHFIIPAAYEFDGATVPRPLWGIFSPLGVAFEAASLHDWLYDTKGRGMASYSLHRLSKEEVDQVFWYHMMQDHTPQLQAWLMKAGVKTPIGQKFWENDSYPHYLLR